MLRLYALFFMLSIITLQANTDYIDNDLDGVNDAIDLCPNTPFDVLVDEHGCDMEHKNVPGKLLLQAGVNYNRDSDYDNTTLLNFFADYNYKNWDISLATSNYNTNNLTTIVDAEDDLFLTAGYTVHEKKVTVKIMGGTKFAFMKEDGVTRDNDWFAAFSLDYKLNKKTNLFGYYSYTISADSNTVDYQNFHTLSVGAGYSFTPQWYSSLSFNYASAYYNGGEDYRSLSWYNAYMLNDTLYLSVNYAYGLNNEAYDHTFSFAVGAFFE